MFEVWDHDMKQHIAMQVPKSVLPQVNSSNAFPSLERILRLSSGENGQSTKEMLQAILKEPKYDFISPQTRTVFGNLAGLAEQTFSSVIATMQLPLQQFLSPVLAASTNATDIDILSLRKRPTTLYVVIPTNKLNAARAAARPAAGANDEPASGAERTDQPAAGTDAGGTISCPCGETASVVPVPSQRLVGLRSSIATEAAK
jgi:hypothetical protein